MESNVKFPQKIKTRTTISLVQFSCSVMSDSLRPHESQHVRPPCPSPTPGVHSDSRPSSQWCHPAISSSVVSFSSCPQSLPASESFPMSQLFAWGGQSPGVSALASVLPKKSQGWSLSELVGSPCSARDSQESSPTPQFKSINSSVLSLFTVQLSHPYMTTGKTIALTRRTFVGKVMSLLLNMLSRLVITFLPRRKRLLISWLQSPSAVILEPKKIWSSDLTSGYLSKINESRTLKSCLHIHVHSTTIHNSQEVEITQMSINRWMDKQSVVGTCSGIWFRLKKGRKSSQMPQHGWALRAC